ncbi:MAG: TetR/AcrR family transcriptional regulator [Candidatus Promineifilaceae bacterium]|jgi:AcrR family transcriptional regulator
MNHKDKRVRRTRKALAEALIALTIEKGYEPVTIQEITNRAGVGYRTFFRHYPDKDALLQEVLRTTLADLRQMMGTPQVGNGAGYQPLPVEDGRIIFEHIAANSDLYRVLLSSGSAALEPFVTFAYHEALDSLEEIPDLLVPPPILAHHTVTATFSLVQWWLENDMPYAPEEMAVYLAHLVNIPAPLEYKE